MVTEHNNISMVIYMCERKVLWLSGLLSPGIYLFIRAVGRFLLSSYQVNTRNGTLLRGQFLRQRYTHAEDKSSVGIFINVSLCHCCKLLTQLCHLRISQSGFFFPVTSCSEEVYHETSITNSHSEQQNSFDKCRHASDFSFSTIHHINTQLGWTLCS